MNDRETLQAVLDQIARLKQEHGDVSPALLTWTIEQMLDRSVDRWDDGFQKGRECRGC